MIKKLSTLRYKLQSEFLKFFAHIKVHPYPFWIIVEPNTYEIKGKSYYEVKGKIQPGDIILRGFKKYLDGYFIPGEFSHAGFYVGGEDEKIIHAMTPDVQYTDLVTFMRADAVAIIRFPDLTADDIKITIERAESKLGSPYDYDFMFEKEDHAKRFFSCSELVYFIMKPYQNITGWGLKETSQLMGLYKSEVFLPDDVIPTENSKGEIVWVKWKNKD